MKIVLASQSPRRQELIRKITDNFIVYPSNFDEDTIEYTGNPSEYVEKLAFCKGREIMDKFEEDYILSMDTIVYLNGAVIGKPKDVNDAARIIKLLSNREHEVFTGICVLNKSRNFKLISNERTKVYFDLISDRELNKYLSAGDWRGKAGAYGIQGEAAKFVKAIEGDFYNVVGFPLNRIYNELKMNKIEF